MRYPHSKTSQEYAPVYYSTALKWCHIVIILYFVFYIFSCVFLNRFSEARFAIPWLAAACISMYHINHTNMRWILLFYSMIIVGWMCQFIYFYGWSCGGINFIMPLMVISFFSIYDTVANKIFFTLFLFGVRVGLFYYCQVSDTHFPVSHQFSVVFQVVNTAVVFLNMAIVCLTFSENIQKAEKQLMVYNQELKKQAVTDPLTGLYNRRYLLDMIENYMRSNPSTIFSVAIGDIDLFKNVNDTYGHNCGDQVLKSLSALFREKLDGMGSLCRWGGEEFLFFLPGMNVDAASQFITDINIAIVGHAVEYKGETHHVTMTFGVEEYDFCSNLSELIKRADDKLYYGKTHGRNQVIF